MWTPFLWNSLSQFGTVSYPLILHNELRHTIITFTSSSKSGGYTTQLCESQPAESKTQQQEPSGENHGSGNILRWGFCLAATVIRFHVSQCDSVDVVCVRLSQLSGEAWRCLCGYAHSARLRSKVLIQQRQNRRDEGNMHAVMFPHREAPAVEMLSVQRVKAELSSVIMTEKMRR